MEYLAKKSFSFLKDYTHLLVLIVKYILINYLAKNPISFLQLKPNGSQLATD